MKTQEHFFKAVCTLAIPVALQSMLQSSFSIAEDGIRIVLRDWSSNHDRAIG